MIHIGKNTRSTIISKGISAGQANNNYRGLVQVNRNAINAKNYTQCDSLLIGSKCKANTFPYIDVQNPTAELEHEASVSRVSDEQLFYFRQRGISPEEAMAAIIRGFCKDVFRKLPWEFSVEANQLLGLKLEGAVG
jgi:Fe-S cluster assembly protein SufB